MNKELLIKKTKFNITKRTYSPSQYNEFIDLCLQLLMLDYAEKYRVPPKFRQILRELIKFQGKYGKIDTRKKSNLFREVCIKSGVCKNAADFRNAKSELKKSKWIKTEGINTYYANSSIIKAFKKGYYSFSVNIEGKEVIYDREECLNGKKLEKRSNMD